MSRVLHKNKTEHYDNILKVILSECKREELETKAAIELTLPERPSLHVLARQSDVDPLLQQ